MATWKKVIVSGSAISELDHLGSGILSGSAQIAGDISGSVNSVSSSLAVDIATNKADIAGLDSVYATDVQLDNVSSSIATDVAANVAAIAGLDSTYATDAQLDNVSSSIASDIAGLDSIYATDSQLDSVSSSIASDIAGLDSIYATDAELANVSSSIISTIEDLSSTLAISGSTGNDEVNLVNDALSFVGGTGVTADVTDNQVEINLVGGIISGSATGDAQGQVKLNGVNVDINGLGESATPTFGSVVITGDLDVQGDTTTLNTTNLAVEDKFILLNSGSGSPQQGGLIIDQGAGAGHAYIFNSGSNRFGFTGSLDSLASSGTPDAFVAAVIDEAAGHTDKVEYQKAGNIRVASNGDIFIYS